MVLLPGTRRHGAFRGGGDGVNQHDRSPETAAEAVRRSLRDIEERIVAAGGDLARVTVVAVTKGQGNWAVLAAAAAGLSDIGENYAAELLEKASSLEADLDPPVRWHFLGAVQRNKVARLARVVTCWQSVARVAEAEAIASRTAGRTPEVFVEVDFSGEPGRNGCRPEEAGDIVSAASACGCRVRGLMTVAPLAASSPLAAAPLAAAPPAGGPAAGGPAAGRPAESGAQREAARRAFGQCADLASRLGLAELSMGMTGDLEEAVAAGSTMVRIGTALFGQRVPESHHEGPPSLQQ